jgi:hypothetical protein
MLQSCLSNDQPSLWRLAELQYTTKATTPMREEPPTQIPTIAPVDSPLSEVTIEDGPSDSPEEIGRIGLFDGAVT